MEIGQQNTDSCGEKRRYPSLGLLNLHNYFTYQDGKLFWKNPTGYRAKVGEEVGWSRWNGYRKCRLLGCEVPVHHLIWHYHFGSFILEGSDLDHINGVRDDNHIENLREVTRSNNLMNKGGYGKTSKHRGVYVLPSGKFSVRFKREYLGSFDTEDEAARVWNNHVKDYSPYVRLNEVDNE